MGTIDVTWINGFIKNFAASPANTMKNRTNEQAWAEPLIGYSNGGDPLYKFYKKDIGNFYLLPIEFLRGSYPNTSASPQDLTVVSWILPQTEATKIDQRKETIWPSERWVRSRIFGEEFNLKLGGALTEMFKKEGIEAVAPILSPLWSGKKSEKYNFASTWSERHAAYVAGLGTFGLSDGLITSQGKAHRCGSVIARVSISPTPRPYHDHHAYCLFYTKGACSACAKRCPVGAISAQGHDKNKCSAYLNQTRKFVEEHYGFKGYGCGLCQTDVPCESGIPSE